MEIGNEAHIKILYKHEHHKKSIYIKTKQTSRHMYVLSKLEYGENKEVGNKEVGNIEVGNIEEKL